MALSAAPALRTRARDPHSMFSDRRAGENLVTAFVLARLSILVLSGKASVNVACLAHDQDGLDHRCTVGCRLDVVLGGSPTCEPVQQCPQSSRTGPLTMPVDAEEGRQLGLRRAGSASAMQTTSTTLVVVGLIGLLGVGGAAAFLVDSLTGPVRRAVRVLQAPTVHHRLDQRLRPTTRDELPDVSRLPDTAGDGLLDALWETEPDVRSLSTASDVEESPTPAGVVSTDADCRSVVPVIADVVRQAQLAFDATIEATRAGGADARATTRYAAARGRAHGPTTALWHAVQLDRLVGGIGSACETTVCGSLVRLSTEQTWPVAARDVCPACATLAH